MNHTNSTTVAEKQSAEPTWSDEPWDRVKTAIVQRWPHLDSRDVETLPRDVMELEKFLGEYTESSEDEIQAVVREHAPAPSILQRAGHLGERLTGQMAPPVQSALERVRYEVDEHRGTTTGLVFVAGIAIGALATAAYFRSRPPAPALQSYLPRRFRS
ncbi:hypothetical protein [Aporhodopirellula aestuarii]|uniref:Uncharacterized protein n=1 Tax=Aporhodopirellula aestuarii TaxID=2950107 RepID=A0ABT0U7E7_9BACT|nr:hypothetical protein [Aporhodopirellula aestuarii]MCM2372854.1 hypothetical protein [Aporhodopirellula aestuarii]